MDEVIETVIELAKKRNIKVTKIYNKEKYAIGAFGCTVCSLAGGLFGGPIGLGIGGLVGGLAAYGYHYWTSDDGNNHTKFNFTPFHWIGL